MTLNFTKNLIINLDSWKLQPIQFDVNFFSEKNPIDVDTTFGFYGSEFQPFNQGTFYNN